MFPDTKERYSVAFLESEEVWILEHVWLRGFRVGDCRPARARCTGLHTQNTAQSASSRAIPQPHQQNSAARPLSLVARLVHWGRRGMPHSRSICLWDTQEGLTLAGPRIWPLDPLPMVCVCFGGGCCQFCSSLKDPGPEGTSSHIVLCLPWGAAVLLLEGHCLVPANTISPVPPSWPGTANEDAWPS